MSDYSTSGQTDWYNFDTDRRGTYSILIDQEMLGVVGWFRRSGGITFLDSSDTYYVPNSESSINLKITLSSVSSNTNGTRLQASVNSEILLISEGNTIDVILPSSKIGYYVSISTSPQSDGLHYAIYSLKTSITNIAPLAITASFSIDEDAYKTGTLTATDVDSTALTFSKVTEPTNGVVTVNTNGTYTYTPNANFNGSDSFMFKANDGALDSSAATVSITVVSVNDAPVANAASITTNEDTAKTGTLTATDIDSTSLTYSKVTGPSNGTVTVNSNGSYSYTPNANFNGSDSFTFKANDGAADSAAATVSITVSAVNDAPVSTAVSITTNDDTAKTGTLTATDVDSTSLTYSKVASPSNGTVTVNSNGAYTYTPNANFNGTDSFTFKANDGFLDSNLATVSINIYKKLTISKNSYVAYGLDLAKVTVVGSGTPNSIIEIRENKNYIGQTTVNSDGSWELIYISNYDRHSYALSEVFTSGWRGKDQNLELSIAREMRYDNSIETAILVSKMTQEANSSFSNIDRIHNRAIGFSDESQNIIAIDLTAKNKSFEINGAYQVALGTKGDVIVTTQKSLSPDDSDYKLDAYKLDLTTGSYSLFKPNLGKISIFNLDGIKQEEQGTVNVNSEIIGVGSTYDGNLIYQIKSKTNSIAIENYQGSYVTPWHIDKWTEYYLAYPDMNTYGLDDIYFQNTGVKSISIDPSGKYLSFTYIVGPSDHVGLTMDLQQNKVLKSIGMADVNNFTFHLTSSSDGKSFTYINTPSWYGKEDHVIDILSKSKLILEMNGVSKTVAEGLIPYQEISGDGKFILYNLYGSDAPGIYIFTIETGANELVEKFNKSEYGSNEKIIDQFLKYDYPRSVAASAYFFNNNVKLNEFVTVFPQTDRGNMQAIGSPASGTTISRMLDFGDTPQNVPVLIVNPADLPVMVAPWESYVFDIQSIYRLKTSNTTPTLKPMTIVGESSSETIISGLGNDLIFTMDGNDTIQGDAGNDSIFAGQGDDLIIGGTGYGDDLYDGGDGIDTVKYTSAVNTILVNLLTGLAEGKDIGTDQLSEIENLIGGQTGDTLIGDNNANNINAYTGNDTITGNGGNDTIDGGVGQDTVVYALNASSYTVTSITGGYQVVAKTGTEGTDTLLNVESLQFANKTVVAADFVAAGGEKDPAVAKFWKDNTKTPTETKKADAVNLTDAIAILKMIVGLNVNSNNTALSPYQAIAADFDQSGDVGLTDAIGVLKMVVGLSAPTPTWKYYDDTKLASTYNSAQSLNPKGWTTTALISDATNADSSVKLVGVLTGDVDGSWIGA